MGVLRKEDLVTLQIKEEKTGYSLYLDDKKIHHVDKYKIEQASLPGSVKLTIEMLVKYP